MERFRLTHHPLPDPPPSRGRGLFYKIFWLKVFTRTWLLACLGFLGACGAELVGNPSAPPAVSAPVALESELAIFRQGDATSREILAGVYPGDVVALEVQGGGAQETPSWLSSDPAMGSISTSGVLHLLAPGEFTVQVEKGDKQADLRVRVGTERPYLGTAPDTPPPSEPTPTPSASPDGETPPPEETPPAEPSPPPSVPSDPYADEVVSFSPGPAAGFGSEQFPQIVLGPPQGSGDEQGGFHVLSLGVGGEIVLKSATPILDGPGPDFLVFENPFYVGGNPQNPFAEPGEIAVSRDGIHFTSFPCEPENALELFPGCAGVHPVYANPPVNNLDPTDPEEAGGDSFDLETIGLNWALWIRIRDRSGSGGGVSAGFDLDAVAIIHQ